MASHTKTVRVRIHGRVQGVFFRAWTEEQAIDLDLNGWVRNRSDGTVEAVFSGDKDAVETMLDRCRKGSRAARVTDVDVSEERDFDGTGFEQRPTE